MTDRTTRLVSFALALFVTWSLAAGIDTLALEQHAGATQVSKAPVATQLVSAKTPAPRS